MSEVKIEGKTKLYTLMQLILSIVSCVGIVVVVLILLFGKPANILHQVLDLVIYLLFLIYFLWGFKKPHGNMLRYIMLCFVVVLAYNGLSIINDYKMHAHTLILIAIMFAYVSGRLNKFNKNRWILLVGFILLTYSSIKTLNSPSILNTNSFFSSFNIAVYKWSYLNGLIQYITISLSYLARCYSHVKLGKLADEKA